MSGKFALIIGNTEYTDSGLAQLTAPSKDAEDFARVLKDQKIGAFDDVNILLNQPDPVVREAIDDFFNQKKTDDLLVLYFSGHGVRDELGTLYLAVKNTNLSKLRSTAVKSDFIRETMDQSRSKRQIIILDCCNSGAFAQGTKAATGVSIGTASAFKSGYGRIILTASDSTQFAWEGNKFIGETENSLFTHYLVEGLEGEADLDGDGRITVDELYNYTYEKVRHATTKQTPSKFSSKQQGEIVLRQNIRIEDIKPALLPPPLLDSIDNPFSSVRLGAVQELIKILNGKNLGLARSAKETLERVAEEDDSHQVSRAAFQALEAIRLAEQATFQKAKEDSLAAEKAEVERKAEEERIAKARLEAERLAKEKAETERKAEEERIAKARLEAERLAKEKAGVERKAEEERIAKARLEAERLAKEKAETERKTKEKAERLLAEQKAEEERIAKDRLNAERKAKTVFGSFGLLFFLGIFIVVVVIVTNWPSPTNLTEDCSKVEVFCVGLVTDVGKVNDKSFNQSAWEGVQKAQADGNADVVQFIETADAKDYAKNIATFGDAGYDVIVTVGFSMGEAAAIAAATYPNINFIGVNQFQAWPFTEDTADDVANLTGLIFPEDNAGFLVGALAAMMSQSHKIGAVCGTEVVPPVWRYGEGYKAGAEYADGMYGTTTEVFVIYHSDVGFDKTFFDPEWGAQTANSMIDRGADVIFSCDSSLTGGGAITAAAQAGTYAIGAETDQYLTLPEVAPRMLSSAIGLITPGVAELITAAKDGSIVSGNFTGDAGYAPFHDLDSSVPAEVKSAMEKINSGLLNSSIKTNVPTAKP